MGQTTIRFPDVLLEKISQLGSGTLSDFIRDLVKEHFSKLEQHYPSSKYSYWEAYHEAQVEEEILRAMQRQALLDLRGRFSEAEMMAIRDAMFGIAIDERWGTRIAQGRRILTPLAELVEDCCENDCLTRRHEIDCGALVEKLANLNPAEHVALALDVKRWLKQWGNPAERTSGEGRETD